MSVFDNPNFLDDLQGFGKKPWMVNAATDSQPIGMGAMQTATPMQMPEIGVGGVMQAGKPGGMFSGFGMDEAKLAMGGLQTIGQLWGAIQSAKLAKKSFNFQKEMGEANFANQMRAYNDALDGKRRTRQIVEGQTDAESKAYYDRFKAVRKPGG